MAEQRAVQVSHELWVQMMTEGYTSGGIKCIEGLPEDARFVTAFLREALSEKDGDAWIMRPDPVFIFESDQWTRPARGHTLKLGGIEYPVYDPFFQVAECRTCKWWGNYDFEKNWAECLLTPFDQAHSQALNIGSDPLRTEPSFGCTQYEPRETDD